MPADKNPDTGFGTSTCKAAGSLDACTPRALSEVSSFLSGRGLFVSPPQTFPFEGQSVPTPNPSLWESCSFGFWKDPGPSLLFGGKGGILKA